MSRIVSREWSFDEPDTTELVRFIGSRGEMWEPTPLLNPEHHHPLLDRTVSTPAASAHRLSAGLNKAGIRWPSFRTGAKYPQARIDHGRAGDDILWQYYCEHYTFAGAYVYIEPNVCPDPAAAARDDYFEVDLRWPTFMSAELYPWAEIEHGTGRWPCTRAGDNSLSSYYRKHGAYSGAMVYIKPSNDTEPVDVIWNNRGDMVMMQFRP